VGGDGAMIQLIIFDGLIEAVDEAARVGKEVFFFEKKNQKTLGLA